MSRTYCKHGVCIDGTHPDEEDRCYQCEPPTLHDLEEAYYDGLEEGSAEVERLRGLIKSVEHCAWCEGGYPGHPEHEDVCPAFTPTGEVK